MSPLPKRPVISAVPTPNKFAPVLLPLAELAKFHETPCEWDEVDDLGLDPVAILPNGEKLYDPQEYLERMIRNARGFFEDDDETVYAPAIYQVPDRLPTPRKRANRKSRSIRRRRKDKSRENAEKVTPTSQPRF